MQFQGSGDIEYNAVKIGLKRKQRKLKIGVRGVAEVKQVGQGCYRWNDRNLAEFEFHNFYFGQDLQIRWV